METPESRFLSPEAIQKLLERLVEDTRRDMDFLEKRIEQNEKKGKLTPVLQPKGAAKEEQKLLQHYISEDKERVKELREGATSKAEKYINLLPEGLKDHERQKFQLDIDPDNKQSHKDNDLSASGKMAFASLKGLEGAKFKTEIEPQQVQSPFRSAFVKDSTFGNHRAPKEEVKEDLPRIEVNNLDSAFTQFQSRFLKTPSKEEGAVLKDKSKEGDKDER